MPDSPTSVVRSLADDIRGRSDAALRDLLVRRPDLARPAPSDLTALAARASTRASTARAIDGLDVAHLQVLDAAAVGGDPVSAGEVARLLGTADLDRVERVLDELWEAALLWGDPDGRHLVRTVSELLGPYPAGLGPPAHSLEPSVPVPPAAAVRATAADAPPRARAILERLAWGPPVGLLGDGTGSLAPEDGPGWLVAHGLAAAPRPDQIVLPQEVAIALRGDRLHDELRLVPPTPTSARHTTDDVDAAAGAAATEALAEVDELLATWSAAPPRVLRGGGLGVRDLAGAARSLAVDEARAATLVEVAYAAGLLADDGETEPVWGPTAAYDRWRDLPGGERWAELAASWLTTTRAPHLVGTRTREARAVNALGPDAHWPPIRLPPRGGPPRGRRAR